MVSDVLSSESEVEPHAVSIVLIRHSTVKTTAIRTNDNFDVFLFLVIL